MTRSPNPIRLSRLLTRLARPAPRAPAAPPDDPAEPLLDWGRRLLPAHFAKPPSAMHRWLAGELDRFTGLRGQKVNLVGPRGGAKSTIGSLALVLRAALSGREGYIWIVSDTARQARTHLENVKSELTENPLLHAAYPQATGRGPVWRAGKITLRSGAVIEAYGAGQRLRGKRRRQLRPTLIVCDDLQNDSHIVSARQRAASRDWFHGALLKAGSSGTNLVNLATALHREAIAMELLETPGWRSRLFRAIERWPDRTDLWGEWEKLYRRPAAAADAEAFYQQNRDAMHAGARVLWPEEEDLPALMKQRAESGRTAFEREKQSSPVDPTRCEWPEAYFAGGLWFDDWPHDLRLCTLALDPSKGAGAQQGDYSAYVLLGIDAQGVLHVDADLARRPTPQMVADGVALVERFAPDVFGVEANQYQSLLCGEFAQALSAAGLLTAAPLPIENHTNKLVRIRRLGPYLAQGRLRFKRHSPGARLLVDQLRDFPLGAHDDGPDALEMAVRLAEDLWRGRHTDDGLGDRLRV
ncbi:Terminase-like family protein [Pirellulimonas nuda]|uniref:Terminase-like family protein n=1 Tax=Pirellulimonas nuda TaxID=2528009 RepID=A0A518D666_9BACT|nr:hypothetical protein [Pirellulimonas nuda]QDU86949.1 Terminase-like family protein [Pirellulimonas nuda]